jgi:hypothetical protein
MFCNNSNCIYEIYNCASFGNNKVFYWLYSLGFYVILDATLVSVLPFCLSATGRGCGIYSSFPLFHYVVWRCSAEHNKDL